MAKELNKKLLLFVLKYAPIALALGYFIQLILSCFGIYSIILALLFGQSILAILVLILCSICLGYCIWHRLPLYYILFGNLISTFDYYFYIPIVGQWMLIVYLLLTAILVLFGCLIKNKEHVKERNVKEISDGNSR